MKKTIYTQHGNKWLFRIKLCHLFRFYSASDFGSNRATVAHKLASGHIKKELHPMILFILGKGDTISKVIRKQ